MKKIRTCAALLLAVLLIPMLTGCIQGNAEETLPPAARTIQTEPPQTEPLQTQPVQTEPLQTTPAAPAPADPAPAPAPAPADPAPAPAPADKLTREEAEAIALKHAGLKADQVTRLRTEYEIDDRIPQYDIEFHAGDWEYEYEIHAETGKILSFDKDAERS